MPRSAKCQSSIGDPSYLFITPPVTGHQARLIYKVELTKAIKNLLLHSKDAKRGEICRGLFRYFQLCCKNMISHKDIEQQSGSRGDWKLGSNYFFDNVIPKSYSPFSEYLPS